MVSNKISTKILQDLVVSVKRGLSSYYLQKEGDEIPFINIGNIRDGGVDASTVSMIHVKDASALDKTKIEPNDIIISIKGSSFKTAIADESIKDFVISANLIAFKLNDEILPEIVVAYLNSPKGQGELQARSAGAVQKALNLKSLMET
ncbi:MAG: restriction endonuclease subunit S, partial [Candidatus Diapherotrites archaeon]|nr:restriction endonuclease subunit S [Candidatus Diapherotrites archaeon]